MNKFWTIVKKELYRFFSDKKLLISLFLPGLIIFLTYTLMGNLMPNIAKSNVEKGHEFKVAYVNKANGFASNLESSLIASDYKYLEFIEDDVEEAKDKLKSSTYDVVLKFEENFENKITQYILNPTVETPPNVETLYVSTSEASTFIYQISLSILDATYNLHTYSSSASDLSPQDGTTLKIMSAIFPMIIISLLFSHVLSITPESIAGEKERGTIATLLITPISRTQLAAGKITSLSIVSLLGAIFSFLGTAFSIPYILKDTAGGNFSLSFGQYAMVFALIISTVLMITSFMSIISTFAKTVKEANAAMGAMVPIAMIFSFISGFFPVSSIGIAFIPVFNVSTAITQIINQSVSAPFFIVTIVMNLIYTGIAMFAVIKMFNNEKIMFNR